MRDGRIECSAALGRVAQPHSQGEPDSRQPDGAEYYKTLAAYENGGVSVSVLKQGESYVAFVPLTRLHLEPPPLHFTHTLTDTRTLKPVQVLGEAINVNPSIVTTEGTTRAGDRIYTTRCSIKFYNCVTAYASLDDVIAANRSRFAAFVALCCLAGACTGLLLSLLYRRNKGLDHQLRRAIARDRLRMVYQPIVDLASGFIVGAEALARWTDEEGSAVSPDVFVRIAEERGFVEEITALAVRHSLRDLGSVLRRSPGFRVTVNVTATDLCDPAFLPMLERSLTRESIPARCLGIEITESSTARIVDAIETIRQLRQRGHLVYIDDFGTGYSSLAYLQDLAVDAIKIDRSFTQSIGTDAAPVVILPQILLMAEALNLQVVVEGIETRAQADYFSGKGNATLGQGWLFGKPVPAMEFARLLTDAEEEAEESYSPAADFA